MLCKLSTEVLDVRRTFGMRRIDCLELLAIVVQADGAGCRPVTLRGPLASRGRRGHNDYMRTQTVGSRELKVRLGTYLRRVRNGQRLVVTDRGQPVAELRPIEAATDADALLAELEARGMVTRPTRKGLTPFTPVKRRGKGKTASQIVVEDREDRF